MLSINDLSQAFGVSNETVRQWTIRYAELLDKPAQPTKNAPRRFSEEDASKLALVAQMRASQANWPEIEEALKEGSRGQWPPTEVLYGEEEDGVGLEYPPATVMRQMLDSQARIANLEGQLTQLEDERDRLLNQLNEIRAEQVKLLVDQDRLQRVEEERAALRQQHLEAVERAARAEAELEMLRRSQQPTEPPTAPQPPASESTTVEVRTPQQESKKSWWDRLRGK